MNRCGIVVVPYKSRKYQLLVGENSGGIEIKFQDLMAKTDNLWIETHEKACPREGDYVDSGIYRNDNGWLFVTGDYRRVYIFSRKVLQLIRRHYDERENNTKTSKGYLLPRSDAEKYAASVIVPHESDLPRDRWSQPCKSK